MIRKIFLPVMYANPRREWNLATILKERCIAQSSYLERIADDPNPLQIIHAASMAHFAWFTSVRGRSRKWNLNNRA